MHTEDAQRNEGDLYETPYSMTDQLLKTEFFNEHSLILEPACGKGSIVAVLKDNFFTFYAYDIYDYGQSVRRNFLFEKHKYDIIITNPPYSLADEFVIKAKEVCRHKFAFLLRTNYLSGQTRYRKNVYKYLETVYIFTRMSDLRAPIREDGKYPTAGIVYAWFIWSIGFIGKPQIKWIDNSKYVLRKKDI